MAKRGNGEGSIYKRKEDGKWVGSIKLDTGKRKVFYGKTKKEVTEKLIHYRHDQQQGILVPSSQQTVAEFFTRWLEDTQKHSLRPRAYERYEEVARLHIVPVLGKLQLQKLEAQHVQMLYTKKIEAGLSPTTVNTIHGVLHKALENAVRWNLVPRNVCDLVSPPRRAHYEVQVLTVEEINKLLDAARGHYLEALFYLAIATGLRRGELMGLKWQDIDWQAGTLQVKRTLSRVPSKLPGRGYIESETKTKKSRRSIVMASFALESLKRHKTRQAEAMLKAGEKWQHNDYVFCTSIGTHLNPSKDILDQLKKLLEKAGLPDIRFHDLRHSAATLLLSEGVHPKVVQEILGHSQISMTMDIYSHVLPNMQKDAMSKLDSLIVKRNDDDDDGLATPLKR